MVVLPALTILRNYVGSTCSNRGGLYHHHGPHNEQLLPEPLPPIKQDKYQMGLLPLTRMEQNSLLTNGPNSILVNKRNLWKKAR